MPNVLIAVIAVIGFIIAEIIFLKAMKAERMEKIKLQAEGIKTDAKMKIDILSSPEIKGFISELSDIKDRIGILEVASGLKNLKKP